MTILSAIRNKTMPTPRRRRSVIVDSNADITTLPRTGDPRLDLARAVNQAAAR